MNLDERALEAAHTVMFKRVATGEGVHPRDIEDAISAYLSALTPPDVAAMVERLTASFTTRCTTTGQVIEAGLTNPDGHEASSFIRLQAAQITHLSSENALLRERDGWKPIETAPKDGTQFLAFSNGAHFNCWWHENGYGEAYWMDDADSEPSPSHWRDLPASPSHKEQRANPIALDELSRRGMDERMQEVVTLLVGETVPTSAAGKVTEGELWALRFGPPCACGERGLSPNDGDESGYCNDCRAAEGPAHD